MRIDRVREYVFQHCREAARQGREPGVRAQEVAEALGIWRNDAAVDLNALVAQGVLSRSGKKNILYYPADPEGMEAPDLPPAEPSRPEMPPEPSREGEDAFAGLIGANGSLKYQIQAAKAAVSYPPCGLHMLITGQPGVGKSMFSEAVWRYASQTGAFPERQGIIPFVRFNCAEYGDNPQLLLSHLFGHKKGAFTGATEHKVGLVEEAAGGILFLDEIHCLTQTGQELFFTLLDTGLFRRMGETTTRQSRFMLIGATSKPVNDVLLDTFRRRIPILIQIPNLADRPPQEKLDLIRMFFAKESSRLRLPIEVSGQVVELLAAYRGEANIGDLENVIQIACAKSYFRRRTGGQTGEPLRIRAGDLSIQSGGRIREADEEGKEYAPMRPMTVRPGEVVSSAGQTYGVSIYDLMEGQAAESPAGEGSWGDVTRMDSHYQSVIKLLDDGGEGSSLLEGMISSPVLRTAEELLGRAANALSRTYPPSAQAALALHLQQYLDRMRSGLLIYNPHLPYIQEHHREELDFLQRSQPWLSSLLGYQVSEDELGFLAVFLAQVRSEQRMPQVGLVVVSCGRKTARSMVEFANRTFATHYAHWVDNKNLYHQERLFEELCSCVKTYCGPGGALILSDVEAFAGLEDRIAAAAGVPCRVVAALDQWLVLEACKLLLGTDCPLDTAYRQLCQRYGRRMETSYLTMLGKLRPVARRPQAAGRRVALSVCTTGVGAAERVQRLLKGYPNLEVVTMSVLDDVQARAEELGDALRLVVGTVDPGIRRVPFVGVGQLFSPGGTQLIEAILDVQREEPLPQAPEPEDLFQLLAQQVGMFAPNLDGERVVSGIRTLLDGLRELYGAPLDSALESRIFLHTAAMLERVKGGAALDITPEQEAEIQQGQEWFDQLSGLLERAFQRDFGPIPQGERYFFLLSLPERDEL